MKNCPATGKVAYTSKAEALNAREKIHARVRKGSNKRRVWESSPYRCPACGSWHFASA